MELIWNCPKTMTIPNVGTVRQGVRFSIDEDRGKDLLDRKLAIKPIPPKKEIAVKETNGIDAATPQGKE